MNGFSFQSGSNQAFQSSDDIPDDKDFSDSFLTPEDLNHGPVQDLITNREFGLPGPWNFSCSNRLIPNKFYSECPTFDSWIFNGQFSPSGDIYYCTTQKQIRIFNTTDPLNWTLQKSLDVNGSFWTFNDVDLSPCERFLILSSFESKLRLTTIDDSNIDENNFNQGNINGITTYDAVDTNSCIFTVKFSGDSSKVIAGTNRRSLEMYDLVKKQLVCSVLKAHDDDVNSVCFMDTEKENIIASGSDESCIKIWDLRCLKYDGLPQGVLVGHREGVTYVSPKYDGISLVSNSKDQTLKLWDIRTMTSQKVYIEFKRSHRYQTYFDYRWETYPLKNYRKKLAADTSLMTFRGHSVLGTCIRCFFSPIFSTGQRFIYTGSSDGDVYIFDSVTGKKAGVLRDPYDGNIQETKLIRDVSWHPFVPLLCAASFRKTILSYNYSSIE